MDDVAPALPKGCNSSGEVQGHDHDTVWLQLEIGTSLSPFELSYGNGRLWQKSVVPAGHVHNAHMFAPTSRKVNKYHLGYGYIGSSYHEEFGATALSGPSLSPPTASPPDFCFWSFLASQGGTWMWRDVVNSAEDPYDLQWLTTAIRSNTALWCTDCEMALMTLSPLLRLVELAG